PHLGCDVDEALLSGVERTLFNAINEAEDKVAGALAENDYAKALTDLAALRAPIDAFFEEVMIMDEDQALRENRLRLLNRFVSVFVHVADFSHLSKTK
ncbi:MAG: DALR anticodon-binding domain-containing protein, partial [Eggerthellaceae bacterium]